jgi:hypothetical protein
MAQDNNPAQTKKHICIFQLERKGAYFTADVVCTVCGEKLASPTRKIDKHDAQRATQPQ